MIRSREAVLDAIEALLPVIAEGKRIGGRRAKPHVRRAMIAAERILKPSLDRSMMREAQRAYQGVKANLESVLLGTLGEFQDDLITKQQFRMRLKEAIRTHYESAFSLGLRFGGTTFGIDQEDLVWLKGASKEEFGFLENFITAIERGTGKLDPVDRMRMYVDSLDGIFNAGSVEAQDDRSEIRWVLSPFADHCRDCVELASGGPYTRDTLPTTPRAGDTQCISNCKCRLVFRQKAVEPDPVVDVVRGGMPPLERVPEGLRRANEAEQAYIENLLAQIGFSRSIMPSLTGQARRAEILARKRMSDRLINFMQERKIWEPPTWAVGNKPLGGAIHRETLDEMLSAVDLTSEQMKRLRRMSRGKFDDILDRFEAGVLAKETVRAVTDADLARADEIERVGRIALAAGLVGVLAADGEVEPAEPGEEDREEGVEEDVVTTAKIAPRLRRPRRPRRPIRDEVVAVLDGSMTVGELIAATTENS